MLNTDNLEKFWIGDVALMWHYVELGDWPINLGRSTNYMSCPTFFKAGCAFVTQALIIAGLGSNLF